MSASAVLAGVSPLRLSQFVSLGLLPGPGRHDGGMDEEPRYVSTQVDDRIATITFGNEPKRNALSSGMLGELLDALADLRERNVRVLVLRAAGSPHVWSSGHDVTELPIAEREPLPYDDPLEQLIRAVRKFPAPVIAMVHGTVWGGACDLVINCDLVIADHSSTFAITPARLGVPYNPAGIHHFMTRLPLVVVKEMFFTAEPLSPDRALQSGLINRLVREEELEEITYHYARVISTRSPQAIEAFKAQMQIMAEAIAVSAPAFEYIENLRRRVYTGSDYREGIAAFAEKRTPIF